MKGQISLKDYKTSTATYEVLFGTVTTGYVEDDVPDRTIDTVTYLATALPGSNGETGRRFAITLCATPLPNYSCVVEVTWPDENLLKRIGVMETGNSSPSFPLCVNSTALRSENPDYDERTPEFKKVLTALRSYVLEQCIITQKGKLEDYEEITNVKGRLAEAFDEIVRKELDKVPKLTTTGRSGSHDQEMPEAPHLTE